MTTDLRTRLLAHAAVHDACTSEHSDEQAQWARDLREAAALLAASTSPAAAAVADAPRIPDADTYCERHTLAASDEWKRGWNYARVIQAKFGHTPDPQDVEPATPPPSPCAAEQATVQETQPVEGGPKVVCHAEGDRCLGCDHYKGKAPVCKYAPSASPAEAPADALFAAIQHGDEVHREWLREAVHAWFDGKPVPPPRAAHPQPVAPAGQAAAGVQGEELKRLADKALDARGALCVVPWLQRTDAQIARCNEARAALLAAIDAFAAPAVERGVAEERAAFDAALKQTWKMVDPLKPCGQPGSYARGEYNGICAALTTMRENFARALSTAGKEQA